MEVTLCSSEMLVKVGLGIDLGFLMSFLHSRMERPDVLLTLRDKVGIVTMTVYSGMGGL